MRATFLYNVLFFFSTWYYIGTKLFKILNQWSYLKCEKNMFCFVLSCSCFFMCVNKLCKRKKGMLCLWLLLVQHIVFIYCGLENGVCQNSHWRKLIKPYVFVYVWTHRESEKESHHPTYLNAELGNICGILNNAKLQPNTQIHKHTLCI